MASSLHTTVPSNEQCFDVDLQDFVTRLGKSAQRVLPKLKRFLWRWPSLNDADIEDVLQTAVQRVLQSARDGNTTLRDKSDDDLDSYLFATAKNVAVDLLKKKKEEEFAVLAQSITGQKTETKSELDVPPILQWMRDALRSLTDVDQRILFVWVNNAYSMDPGEVNRHWTKPLEDELGLSPAALRNRRVRICRHLKAKAAGWVEQTTEPVNDLRNLGLAPYYQSLVIQEARNLKLDQILTIQEQLEDNCDGEVDAKISAIKNRMNARGIELKDLARHFDFGLGDERCWFEGLNVDTLMSLPEFSDIALTANDVLLAGYRNGMKWIRETLGAPSNSKPTKEEFLNLWELHTLRAPTRWQVFASIRDEAPHEAVMAALLDHWGRYFRLMLYFLQRRE